MFRQVICKWKDDIITNMRDASRPTLKLADVHSFVVLFSNFFLCGDLKF